MSTVISSAVHAARCWAVFYRDERGYQPLPSDPTRKRPLLRYGQWWEERAPSDLFDRFPTSNIQIMTGRFWGLLVIDLDGPEAIEHWATIAPCPRTWITRSGNQGQHLWYTISTGGKPLPKARLWGEWDSTANAGKGDRIPRRNIERLCDHSLVMAPPSIHPTTGNRYRFLAGHSPKEIPRPAWCPSWILDLPALTPPRSTVAPLPSRPEPKRRSFTRTTARSSDVLDAIHDKMSVARSWGLRIASDRPNAAGWCPCHAIDRPDRDPSASFNPATGTYWEPESGSTRFFDLAVRLGAYLTWTDAKDDLAQGVHVR